AAVTNNASGCLRLLANGHLAPGGLRRGLEGIVAGGSHASAAIGPIRSCLKRTACEKSRCNVNDVIHLVIAVTRLQPHWARVLPQLRLRTPLPFVRADRGQLQQVLLNLIMNGIEAMAPVTDRARMLWMQSEVDASGDVMVSVRDSGTGLGVNA